MVYLSVLGTFNPRFQELFPDVLVDGVLDYGVFRYILEPDSLSVEDILMMRMTFTEGNDYFLALDATNTEIEYIRRLSQLRSNK